MSSNLNDLCDKDPKPLFNGAWIPTYAETQKYDGEYVDQMFAALNSYRLRPLGSFPEDVIIFHPDEYDRLIEGFLDMDYKSKVGVIDTEHVDAYALRDILNDVQVKLEKGGRCASLGITAVEGSALRGILTHHNSLIVTYDEPIVDVPQDLA